VQSFIIQKHSVRALAVGAQRFAVIGHHRDHGFVIDAVLAQPFQQLAEAGVGVGDFSVVGLRRKTFLIGRRRVIGIMRVVQMNPEKEGFVRNLAEPSQGMLHHNLGSPLHRLVAIRAVAAQVKTRVIDVEAAIKSRGGSVQRIKHQRRHKRSRLVSPLMQDVRQVRQPGGERNAKIIYVIKLRVSPGEDSGVRSRGQRNMGVGASEHHTLLRHRIQIGRQLSF
jgi:hypothetical protein